MFFYWDLLTPTLSNFQTWNAACYIIQVFGFDVKGTIVLSDLICEHNWADYNGGCFYGSGRTVVDEGTVMLDNAGSNGGSVCECHQRHPAFLSGDHATHSDIHIYKVLSGAEQSHS